MGSTAALVAGWAKAHKRDRWGLPWVGPASTAGSLPVQGPEDPIGLKAEIYLGDLGWIDISTFVYYRDKVRIARGRGDETSQVSPQTCALTLNNRGGTFTPRLATGPYFKLIGRNTPIRISRTWNGNRFYRYYGEVPAWPTTSDISGQDVYEQITAAGPLRRIRQGSRPLRSPMYRAYTRGTTAAYVTAYWSCEDGSSATSFATGLPGGTPMTFTGSPQLAKDTTFVCSAALPVLNGSAWTGVVPSSSGSTANVLRFLMSIPATGDTDTAVVARMFTTGTIARVDVQYGVSFGGTLQLSGYDGFGNQLFASGYGFANLTGRQMRVSVELQPSGSNVACTLLVMFPGQRASAFTVSVAGTVGAASSIIISPNGNLAGTVIGHVSYQPTWDTLYDLALPLNAWLGEPPDAVQPNDTFQLAPGLAPLTMSRFTRLCSEQNINPVVISSTAGYDVDAGPTASVGMGYQTVDTFSTLIEQVPDTTGGMMFETRDQVGVAIRTRASLYNQAAKLTLDHSQHQLSAPLNPVDDDQLTRNDITVTRVNGSSVTTQLASGALSIQDPPLGVGDYQTEYQLSLASDSLLADAAGWRLHMGTVDEPRYPTISLNLRHPTFTSNVDLMNAALTLDIGDRIVINNPPPELPPDPISLIVQGYSETLGVYEHDMVIICSPESPYRIAILEDPVLGHADTDGSTLGSPLGPTDTAISLVTTNASSPTWTTNGQDTPFDVNVGGERITLACAGTLLNQNPFFATNINGWSTLGTGTTASWSTDYLAPGAAGSLKVVPPGGVATIDAHDTLTGVGTVTPSQTYVVMGWVYSPGGWSDLRVCVDWYDSSGVFVSSSLGSGSVVAAGTWTFLTQTLTAAASASQAQLRVRQGGTPTSTDIFYCWAVRMIPSSSVSTSSPQTFTGIRSVNGVVKAQTAGTDVRLWQPMILSL